MKEKDEAEVVFEGMAVSFTEVMTDIKPQMQKNHSK